VDLKALGNFPFDETNGTIKDVPPVYRDLDGKKVQLEGFMYAGNSASDELSAFQFVYNISKCCFNGPPKVQERVFARSNLPVPFYGSMVRCTGTLHVAVRKNEAGQTNSVYDMEIDKSNRYRAGWSCFAVILSADGTPSESKDLAAK